MVRRGEIYWVEFDPVKGSEQGGVRPALVVQNDTGNRYSATTLVVGVTTTIPPEPYPFIVVVPAGTGGLARESAINCAQLATIQQTGPESRLRSPKGESTVRPLGQLPPRVMDAVDAALMYELALRNR
jgi:mRNA interferase MazF